MSKFTMGRILATPGALEKLTNEDITNALNRHVAGDWGDLCKEDKRENELSLSEGFRLMSSYTSSKGEKFWIITEADRSVTTVLLPEEY